MTTAASIPATDFRAIVLLPLALDRNKRTDPTAELVRERWHAIEAGGLWSRISDPAEHIALADTQCRAHWQAEIQAEASYFHDFIRELLFPQPASPRSTPGAEDFRLYRRSDVGALDITWYAQTRRMAVERLNLYVLSTGAAVLVLEVRPQPACASWSLADVQDFHERFRRSYAPYANRDAKDPQKDLAPGGIVDGVVLHGADRELSAHRYDRAHHLALLNRFLPSDGTAPQREAQVLPHWEALLGHALPMAKGAGGPRWINLADDRLPMLLAVSVTAPGEGDPMRHYRAIHRGDFVRLCLADGSGPAAYPYNPAVLADFEHKHCYDWFHTSGTRFMVSGPAFVAIGAGEFFDTHIITHTRRHYFQMALLLHIEMATLLTFSRALSRAAEAQAAPAAALARTLEPAARRLQEEFLQFVHRFRFTGVSHQMQGQVLFAQWRGLLGLQPLFTDLQTELRASVDFLHSEWERREARAAEQLTGLAAVGVVAGLPMAFLGMNVLDWTAADVWPTWLKTGWLPPQVPATLMVFSLFLIAGGWLMRFIGRRADAGRRVRLWLYLVGLGAMLLMSAALLAWRSWALAQ